MVADIHVVNVRDAISKKRKEREKERKLTQKKKHQ